MTDPAPATAVAVPPIVAGRWGIGLFALVLGPGLVLMQLGGLLGRRFGGVDRPWLPYAAAIPGFLLFWVVGWRGVSLFDDRGPRALGLQPRPLSALLHGVYYYVSLGLVWWLALFVYTAVLSLLDIPLPEQTAVRAFAASRDDWVGTAALALAVVVAAPLGEEMLFRGVAHGWARRRLPWLPTALIVGSIFGLLHVESSAAIVFAPPLALLGVMLAWVREKPCGLLGCVAFHATHNAVTLAITLSRV